MGDINFLIEADLRTPEHDADHYQKEYERQIKKFVDAVFFEDMGIQAWSVNAPDESDEKRDPTIAITVRPDGRCEVALLDEGGFEEPWLRDAAPETAIVNVGAWLAEKVEETKD